MFFNDSPIPRLRIGWTWMQTRFSARIDPVPRLLQHSHAAYWTQAFCRSLCSSGAPNEWFTLKHKPKEFRVVTVLVIFTVGSL
jgi:hypothetical protein